MNNISQVKSDGNDDSGDRPQVEARTPHWEKEEPILDVEVWRVLAYAAESREELLRTILSLAEAAVDGSRYRASEAGSNRYDARLNGPFRSLLESLLWSQFDNLGVTSQDRRNGLSLSRIVSEACIWIEDNPGRWNARTAIPKELAYFCVETKSGKPATKADRYDEMGDEFADLMGDD